jgi:hypothetical protein
MHRSGPIAGFHFLTQWEIHSMKPIKTLVTLFASLILLVTLGCAATRTHEGTGQYIDDSAITAKVKASILGEPGLKSAEINVETFKGVVQLSGFVSSRDDIDKAVKLARGVKGVKSVTNSMQLK